MAICLNKDSLISEMLESGDWSQEDVYYIDHLTEDRIGLALSGLATDSFWQQYDMLRRDAIRGLLNDRVIPLGQQQTRRKEKA